MQKMFKVIAPILTIIIFIIIAVVMFLSFGFTNRLTPSFWITTTLGTALTVLTTLIWFPVGAERGRADLKFNAVCQQYNQRAEYIVTNQLQSKCNEFCDYKNREHKQKIIYNMLAKKCLSYSTFETYKKYKSNIKLSEDQYKEIKVLNKKQLKLLEYLNTHEIKIKPLTSNDLLKLKIQEKNIKPRNFEHLYKIITGIIKLVWALISFAVLAFIMVNPDTSGWTDKVFRLLVWICIIGYNIYASINSGNKSITEYRKAYYTLLSTKCAEFYEWAGISLLQVDNPNTNI